MSEKEKRGINWRRSILILFTISVSAGFLYLLFSKVDISGVFNVMGTIKIWPLPLAIMMSFVGLSLSTLRLRFLLGHMSDGVGLMTIAKTQLIGFAGNAVLPLRLGELIRLDYLARQSKLPHSKVLAAVGLDRLFDLLIVGVLFTMLLPIILRVSGITKFIVFSSILVSVFAGLVLIARFPVLFARWISSTIGLLNKKLALMAREKALIFADGLRVLTSIRGWIITIALSASSWFCGIMLTRFLFVAFSLELPWYAPSVVVVFVSLAAMLPSAPAFVGTYHYFVVLALQIFGVQNELALSFAIVMHVLVFVPLTLVAMVFLFGDIFRISQKDKHMTRLSGGFP